MPIPASFSDDTSLPYSGGASIHAQIIQENPPYWLHSLKSMAGEGRGELKQDAIDAFFSCSERERMSITHLRKVRIHIADPRPYLAAEQEPMRPLLPRGVSLREFLKRPCGMAHDLQELRSKTEEFIAARMLRDSSAERLQAIYRTWEYANGIRLAPTWKGFSIGPAEEAERARPLDFSPFKHKHKSMLTSIAVTTSASAAVFSPAIDKFECATNDHLFASPRAGPYLLHSALARSHAFDEGNDQQIRWIEKRREDFLETARDGLYMALEPEPLQQLTSSESFEIQAAHVAAGIAKELWRRNNLPFLRLYFDYITYNGEQLSESQADTYQRLISTLRN